MQFINACNFGRLHFQQRHKKRECGLSALILVYAVRMKAIPASACDCIIQGNLQIVFSEKPIECFARLFKPWALFRQPVYLKASGDRCASLDRLLIEARLLAVLQ